jgi:hypothetical protein
MGNNMSLLVIRSKKAAGQVPKTAGFTFTKPRAIAGRVVEGASTWLALQVGSP